MGLQNGHFLHRDPGLPAVPSAISCHSVQRKARPSSCCSSSSVSGARQSPHHRNLRLMGLFQCITPKGTFNPSPHRGTVPTKPYPTP